MKNRITGTDNPKSARYQFNFELQDPNIERVNDARIPGGRKCKKVGGTMGIAPQPYQIEIGGRKKMKGGSMVATRGEVYDTENATPTMEGAGLFGDIGSLIDGVVGSGKMRKPEARQRNIIKLPNPEQEEEDITTAEIKGGMQTIKAGGLFGDIGNGLDAISSIVGLGKKRTPDGQIVAGKMTKKRKGDLRRSVKAMEKEMKGGVKKLLDQLQ